MAGGAISLKQLGPARIGVVVRTDAVASAQHAECREFRSGRKTGVSGGSLDRWYAFDVSGDGVDIRSREMLKTVFDGFAHASGRLGLSGQAPAAQKRRELFPAPASDPRHRIRGDIRRVPGANLGARQSAAGLLLHQESARRMTGAAMGRPLCQIRAAIPLRRLPRIGGKDMPVEKQEIPAQHRQADVHRKRQCGLRSPRVDRLHGPREISVERAGIVVGEFGVRRVGHRGIEVRAIASDSAAKRPGKLVFRVPSDPELRGRGDIGGIDGAERRADRQPAGKGFSIGSGVAGGTIGGDGKILAALDRGLVGGRIGLFSRS